MGKKYDIVIIGSGLSGLAAAYKLSFSNKKVLLIEKGEIGGRASSVIKNKFILDTGAVYIMFGGKAFYEIAHNLKFHNEVIPIKKKIGYLFDNLQNLQNINFTNKYTLLKSLIKFNLITKKDKLSIKLLKFMNDCIKDFRLLKADYKNLQHLQTDNAYDFLSERFSNNIIEIFQPISKTFLMSDLKNVTLGMFRVLMGSIIDTKNNIFHVKGGIGTISSRLEKYIASKNIEIIKEEVKYIKKDKLFKIKTANSIVFSKSLISSIPIEILKNILDDSINIRKISNLKHLPAISIYIALESPLNLIKENHIVFLNDKRIVFIGEFTQKDNNLAPNNKGLLYVFISPDSIEDMIKKSDKKIMEEVDSVLNHYFSDYEKNKIFYKIFKWDYGFSLTNKQYFEFLDVCTNLKGFFIIGDIIYPGIDGIMQSGIMAAEHALDFLGE